MKKLLYSLLLLSLSISPSLASHLIGGELRYAYDGTNYVVTVVLYRDCATAAMPNSITLDVNSASLSKSNSKNIALVKQEDIAPQCATANRCISGSSTLAGYQIFTYQDTVQLTAAADWIISAEITSRIALNNMGSGMLYLEATLDNTTYNNSIAYTPSLPAFAINTSTTTAPLQTLDPDGDSLVFEQVLPMYSGNSSAIYNTGYTFANPLGAGGVYSIDAVNQNMTLKGVTQGRHALAYQIKEYRNGVLMGTHVRDFVVDVMPSATLTYPALPQNLNTTIYTCPGSNTDSAKFTITDPTSGDSVYIEIDTPQIAGFTFKTNVQNGKPTATAYCTWAVPSTINLQTVPYFFVDVSVYDNGCPRATTRYAILVKTRPCNADSVWAGDANDDNVVDLKDVLAIGLNYGETGTTRANASTNWIPQASQNWANSWMWQTNTVNMKHTDCNGDGTVDNNDLTAINVNYSKTHPKGGAAAKTTAGPDLYFDTTGIQFYPGAMVSLPIKLGTTAQPMNDVYALLTQLRIDGITLSSAYTLTTTGSWLTNNDANAIDFTYELATTSQDWIQTRTDNANVSGSGTVATLNFTIPANTPLGTIIDFVFDNEMLYDKDGNMITNFDALDTSVRVEFPVSIANIASDMQALSIVPNPSQGNAVLQLSLAEAQQVNVTVTDIAGKSIWVNTASLEKGSNQIALHAAELASGVYMVRITNEAGISTTVKWVKQ